jgi:putative ABC transport system permease protein
MVTSVLGTRALRTKLRRDLARQRGPFLAVALTVLLGVALFGASYDAFRNLQTSYDRVFGSLAVADVWITGGDTEAIAAAAAGVEGVELVATRVEADLPLRIDGHKVAGRVVGLPGEPRVNDISVTDGQRPGDGRGALAEDHLAAEFDLSAGDTVEVLAHGVWTEVAVTGKASSSEYLWLARNRQEIVALPSDFGVLFVPSGLAEQLAGHGPDQVLVRIGDGADRNAVAGALRPLARAAGATDLYTWDEQPSNAALSEDINGFSQMAFLFPLLFLTAAGMAAYTLLARRIQTERSVIGMMRAHGASRQVVMYHYLGFGLAAAVAGAVPGILLGLWLARLMTRGYVGFLSLPITAVSFHKETPLIGLAFAVFAGGLAAIAPSRAAAAVPPAEAMRGVVPSSGGRRSLLERMVPYSKRLPASWRLVLRSIGRNRRRTAMTMTGVVLALLLILVSWSLLDTIGGNLDEEFNERDRSDAQVALAGPGTDADLDALRSIDGVATVEPMAQIPATLTTEGSAYATILTALPEDTTLRSFDVVEGDPDGLGSPGLLVGAALRDLLDLEVGQRIDVVIGDGEGHGATTMARTVVIGFVQETLGTFAYTSLEGVAAELGLPVAPVTGALVAYEAGADPDVMRERIEAVDTVAAVQSSDALRRLLDDVTGLIVGFVTLMLLVGSVLAATVIFTTVSVSIGERQNEVATLRASGVPLRRIAGLITAENLVVTALGIVPGVVFGVLAGRAMMATYTTDQFAFRFLISPTTIAASVGALLVVAAVSQIPGLRSLRRLDIARILRERSA